jgi:hypothetical protein
MFPALQVLLDFIIFMLFDPLIFVSDTIYRPARPAIFHRPAVDVRERDSENGRIKSARQFPHEPVFASHVFQEKSGLHYRNLFFERPVGDESCFKS